MIAKTDRNDARGMANLLHLGWFRPVQVKTSTAREQRAPRGVLTRRLRDVENSIRGLLRGFGLRLPRLLRGCFEAGVRAMTSGHPVLPDIQVLGPLLDARAALRDQLAILDRRVREVARSNEVCRG